MVHWAQTIGLTPRKLFERMMSDKPHPEMGYGGCLGVIRLAGKYSHARVEAAAERALLTGACRYRSIESILKNALDSSPCHRLRRRRRRHHLTTTSAARSTSSMKREHAARTDDGKNC